MQEIWKDVKEYEGLYQVSNLGNIKSLKRIVNNNGGKRIIKEKILKYGLDKGGYKRISLCKNNKIKQFAIHRLVAETFISNPNNYPNVLHKKAIVDGGNNNASNLYWGTQKDNINDAIRDGHYAIKKPWLNKKGKLNPNSIKINQYDKNGNFIKKWDCITDVERKLKINHGNICSCCKGRQKTAGGFIWKYRGEKL